MNDPEPETALQLSVEVTSRDEVVLLAAVRGDVDLATAPHLQASLIRAIDVHTPEHLVIDAVAMSFLDAAGMAAFVSVYQYAKTQRVVVRMENVRPSIGASLHIVGLIDFFRITARPTDEAAPTRYSEAPSH